MIHKIHPEERQQDFWELRRSEASRALEVAERRLEAIPRVGQLCLFFHVIEGGNEKERIVA